MMTVIQRMAWSLVAVTSLAHGDSPYSGEQGRAIKSLSESDVTALEIGEGMGFAKLAELNSYPGPRHILDLAADLDLSETQLRETEALFEKMRADAIGSGEELIHAEAALDRAFAEQSVDAETLHRSLTQIGLIRARLRYVHLAAHLQQRDILTDAQVAQYDRLRGYTGNAHDHSEHEGHR